MQAPLKEIDEVMENIKRIQDDIQNLKDFTAKVFEEQKTFDESMADGIKQLLEKFKQREQELLERVQSASANSPSAAAATQNEQLSAEITRLNQSLEYQIAAKTILEGNVNAKETRIQELEAEVARLQLHNSEGTDEEEDEDAFDSAPTSESGSDTDSDDKTAQVSLQNPDAKTQNSPKPVSGNGGIRGAAASVGKMLGALIPGNSSAVTPSAEASGTNIVPVSADDQTQDVVPANDQTQHPVAQVNDPGPEVLPSNSDPDNEPANAAGAASGGAPDSVDPANQPGSSPMNTKNEVLAALKQKVFQPEAGRLKYKLPTMNKAKSKNSSQEVQRELVTYFANNPLESIQPPNTINSDRVLPDMVLKMLGDMYDDLYRPKRS